MWSERKGTLFALKVDTGPSVVLGAKTAESAFRIFVYTETSSCQSWMFWRKYHSCFRRIGNKLQPDMAGSPSHLGQTRGILSVKYQLACKTVMWRMDDVEF